MLTQANKWFAAMEAGGEIERTWHEVFGLKYKYGKTSVYHFKKWAGIVGLEKLKFDTFQPKLTLKRVSFQVIIYTFQLKMHPIVMTVSSKARKHYFREWKAATCSSSSPTVRKRKMDDSDSPDSSPSPIKKRKNANDNDSDSDLQIVS